jgi:hypothetical protein
MATKTFYLDEEKKEKLDISFGIGWKNFSIKHNGTGLGAPVSKKELKNGVEYRLPGENVVRARVKSGLIQELELLLNNVPIKGSPTDPDQVIKTTFNLAVIIATLNILIGMLGMLDILPMLKTMGIGLGSFIWGALILLLSFGIKKKSSFAAYAIAGLLALDIILTIVFAANVNSNTPTAGIVIKVIFILYMIKGAKALKKD